MSDINLGVGVEGQAAAVQQLAQITQAQAQLGTAAEQANGRAATSATAASSALNTMAQSGQQLVQRVQGVAGAVQSLVTAMGSRDRTAGLIASTAGTIAQFSALGSMLGPAGTVGGAIAGATVAILNMAEASDSAAAAADRHAEALQRVRQFAAEARTNRLDEAARGRGTFDGASDAELEAMRLERRRQALDASAALTNPDMLTSVLGALGIGNSPEELRGAVAQWEYEIEQIDAEVSRRRESMLTNLENDLDASDRRIEETTNPRRRGGRRRAPTANSQGQGTDDAAFRDAGAINQLDPGQVFGQGSSAADRRDSFAASQSERRRGANGATSMFAEQTDAMREFERGYVSSIDAVIASYEHLRDVSSAAANDVVRSGRFMERGMVAVGNNITEVVGGRMMGAFESALGAWLDGSKSFVEAAEAMAKGVIRSLVQEGIVQAVTETARGIADLASYQYATAGMHFAAAAAWGAVAGVAGAVGAATGSFGGSGAGAGGGPSQREMAERERNDERGAGTTVINLYPGAFATEDERANALRRALNYNARMGRRLDRRLVA